MHETRFLVEVRVDQVRVIDFDRLDSQVAVGVILGLIQVSLVDLALPLFVVNLVEHVLLTRKLRGFDNHLVDHYLIWDERHDTAVVITEPVNDLSAVMLYLLECLVESVGLCQESIVELLA